MEIVFKTTRGRNLLFRVAEIGILLKLKGRFNAKIGANTKMPFILIPIPYTFIREHSLIFFGDNFEEPINLVNNN